MIILGLADLHGRRAMLPRVLDAAGPVDAAVLAGDITDFGDPRDVEYAMDALRDRVPHVLAVPGNCDPPRAADYLQASGHGLHRRGVEVDGVGFFGVGRSLPCPGTTPNETDDDTLGRDVAEAFGQLRAGIPAVMVSHEPPADTRVDLTLGGIHVGSVGLRRFIERHRPRICFCGHIHEAAGTDKLGETWLVNPGPLRNGGYALARIAAGIVSGVEVRAL